MVIGNCSLKVFAYKTRGTLPVKILNSSVTTLLNQVAIISLDWDLVEPVLVSSGFGTKGLGLGLAISN